MSTKPLRHLAGAAQAEILAGRPQPPRLVARPAPRFAPYAWARLLFLRDAGPTEVGGFGISSPTDCLLIEDVRLVRQRCTRVSVEFADAAVADFFDEQVDLGRRPEEFGRVWVHTHPGDCPNPTTQGYLGRIDLGLPKVLATERAVHQIDPCVVVTSIPDRFRPEHEVGEAVFCCVDSIGARAAIWRSVQKRCLFWADGRMLGEVIRVLAASDEADRQHYGTTLLPESEAQAGRCTARSTIYAAAVCAGLMLHQFTRWLRDLPLDVDSSLNLLSGELSVAAAPADCKPSRPLAVGGTDASRTRFRPRAFVAGAFLLFSSWPPAPILPFSAFASTLCDLPRSCVRSM